jgi:hypothetical protein
MHFILSDCTEFVKIQTHEAILEKQRVLHEKQQKEKDSLTWQHAAELSKKFLITRL